MFSSLLTAPRREKGTALVYALGLVLICSMLMAAGSSLLLSSMKGGFVHLTKSQVDNVARAGFSDALMWFKRQESQPVKTFDPGGGDSQEPEMGLVNSFPVSISEGVWGRYEVVHAGVRDVTSKRGREGTGLIWEIHTVGYIYQVNDPDRPYYELPNKVVARRTMVGEVARMDLSLPPSAIISYEGKHMVIGNKTEAQGGGEGTGAAGLTYKSNTGKPNVHGTVEGDPPEAAIRNLDLEVPTVFGVSKQELRTMADYVVGHVDELPSTIPEMSFIYINGNATFNSSRPLIGSGLLVVDGNMTIAANSSSDFSGVVYVTGQFSGSAPMLITGTLVVNGHVNINGGPELSEAVYNASVIETVMQSTGQYRESKSVHIPISG